VYEGGDTGTEGEMGRGEGEGKEGTGEERRKGDE